MARSGGKVAYYAYHYGIAISWLLVFLSIVWVFLYPLVTISTFELKTRGTYFSENALLIRSIEAGCSEEQVQKANEYHNAFISQKNLPPNGCEFDCSSFLPNLLSSIEKTGAEPYLHNGTNVYGILRAAPFGEGGKESILLLGHYRNIGKEWNGAASDIGLGLALLEYLSHVKWLSKDVILLLTDDGPQDARDGYGPGVKSWLDSYHADPFTNKHPIVHAGTIRSALVLDMDNTAQYDLVGILGSGINGQLPNLDLINTAVYALKQNRIPILFDRCGTVQEPACTEDVVSTWEKWIQSMVKRFVPNHYIRDTRHYVNNLNGLFRFMKTVATGPNGPHAELINYNIDSITLTASKKHQGRGARTVGSLALMKSIELVIRAMSNLEEKFHQSFYFYLLPNDHNFISIGEYYFSLAMLVIPCFVQLIRILSSRADLRIAFGCLSTLLAVGSSALLLVATRHLSIFSWLASVSALQLVVIAAIVVVLSRMTILKGSRGEAEWYATMAKVYLERDNQEALKDGIVLDTDEQKEEWAEWARLDATSNASSSLKIYAMLLLIFANSILGILNFSLALICAFLTVPFSLITSHQTRSLGYKIGASMFLLLSSPVIVLSCFVSYESISYFINAYHQMGLFPLIYICCIYIPVHTLMTSVFFL